MPGAGQISILISAGDTLIRPFGAPSPGGRRTRRGIRRPGTPTPLDARVRLRPNQAMSTPCPALIP